MPNLNSSPKSGSRLSRLAGLGGSIDVEGVGKGRVSFGRADVDAVFAGCHPPAVRSLVEVAQRVVRCSRVDLEVHDGRAAGGQCHLLVADEPLWGLTRARG